MESRFKGGLWILIGLFIATAWTFSACGGTEGEAAPVDGTSSSGSSGASSGSSGASSGSSGASSGSSGASSGSSGASSGDAGNDGGSSSGNGNSTEPNLKIAFIGDTSTGTDFKSVLKLIKQEGAKGVLIQGDLTYGSDTGTKWFGDIDGELGTTIPYFVSKGNHDITWGLGGNLGIAPRLKDRMTTFGVTPDDGDPTKVNYAFTFKGLKVVMVSDSETNPTRANYVQTQLANDTHTWKICGWHKNMRESNVGPKGDEMGWAIYENCRAKGAIVAQGHSHTYSRSKTLANDANQTVDANCSDPFALCVGTGKHFFFDSSVGGVDLRSLENETKPHWGATFGGAYGALFIEFNVDGDPNKAKGYFKTVGGVITDPPASSGKQFFTITAQ
jgi:hypothetical protein